jgi:hypothetical protein
LTHSGGKIGDDQKCLFRRFWSYGGSFSRHNIFEKGNAIQGNFRESEEKAEKARHEKTREPHGKKRRQKKARRGETRQDGTRQNKTKQDKARQDTTRHENKFVLTIKIEKKLPSAFRTIDTYLHTTPRIAPKAFLSHYLTTWAQGNY